MGSPYINSWQPTIKKSVLKVDIHQDVEAIKMAIENKETEVPEKPSKPSLDGGSNEVRNQ